MIIRYSSHAVERMIQRRISTTEVEDLLVNPDGLIKQSEDKIVAYKKMEGRKDNSMAVVAIEQEGNFEVVTVIVNFEVKK